MIPAEVETPDDITVTREFVARITSGMERLGAKHREILVLRNVKNLSYEEIAGILGISVGTVKSRIARAREKLLGPPVQVPHEEHRALHMLIYSRLNNPFVTGILEAYWDAYESVGLNMYAGSINYLNKVWDYHGQMVESICYGNHAAGREALIAHIALLAQRPASKGDK